MASFSFEGRSVYYEDHGQGSPLIVLNGIFMSCASWAAFVPAFSPHCRLILVDLLDQGKSGRMDRDYTQSLQVEVVLSLMAHLQLERAGVMGISYGGEVALQLAAAHPERVDKLVLSNTCAHTSKWLKDIGHSWEYAFASHDGHQFFKTCIPIVYAPMFYEKNYAWASAREEMFVRTFPPEVYDAFARLTRSAETHDVRDRLSLIRARTLVISSELDYVTPPYQQAELVKGIPGAAHVRIEGAGHAVMYEKPAEFASLVLGFLLLGPEIKIV